MSLTEVTTDMSIAHKVKAMFNSEDHDLIKQAVTLITSLDREDPELRRDFLSVFGEALGDTEHNDFIHSYDSADLKVTTSYTTLPETQHTLHSLCHSERLHRVVWEHDDLDNLPFYTTNIAWTLSYFCGLWTQWQERGQSLTISVYDYLSGALEGSPLLDLLKDHHIHILSPLDPIVLKLIAELSVIGVASIKLDSLCDEYFGELVALGEDTLELLERGAERAARLTPTQCIVRADPVYTRWVSTVINKHKLKGDLAKRWRFVCLRAALAKTVIIPPEEDRWKPTQLKMVFCPVVREARKGIWVARTLHCSDLDTPLSERSEYHDDGPFEVDKITTSDIPEYFNSWSRSKRYKLPYRVNEDTEELELDQLDLSAKNFRLVTYDEIVEIGQAGDASRVYSGASAALHLHTLEAADREDCVALHSANPWGVYDLGVMEEFVWDESTADTWPYRDDLQEYVRVYGDREVSEIDQESRDPERGSTSYYSQCDFAFRVVMAV